MAKYNGVINGGSDWAVPLIIGKDTVYVHTNIKEIQLDAGDGTIFTAWQFEEWEYGKDEYIAMMADNVDHMTYIQKIQNGGV